MADGKIAIAAAAPEDDHHGDDHGGDHGGGGHCPPPWIITFADMVTLLMAFFVMLLMTSKPDTPKFNAFAASMRQTFGTMPKTPDARMPGGNSILNLHFGPQSGDPTRKPPSTDPVDGQSVPGYEPKVHKTSQAGPADQAGKALGAALKRAMAEGHIEVQSDWGSVIVKLPRGASKEQAKKIAEALAKAAGTTATRKPGSGAGDGAGGAAGEDAGSKAAARTQAQPGAIPDIRKHLGLPDTAQGKPAGAGPAAQGASAAAGKAAGAKAPGARPDGKTGMGAKGEHGTQSGANGDSTGSGAQSGATRPASGKDASAQATRAGNGPGKGGTGQGAAAMRAELTTEQLTVALKKELGDGLVTIQRDKGKVFVTVGSGGAFASGSADLTQAARDIISRIAFASMSDNSTITVTGHTDNVPLAKGSPYVDNLGLAAARAASVVRAISDTGLVSPKRMTAVSKGATDPVASNATAAGRAKNRRIQIKISY